MKPTHLLMAAALAVPLSLFGADPAADNTSTNKRDRSGESLTPIDQSNDAADIKITAEIRRALVADDSLSSNAKNAKVITTSGGNVTLRGPVASAKEKATVAQYAEKAGATSVNNQLEIETTN